MGHPVFATEEKSSAHRIAIMPNARSRLAGIEGARRGEADSKAEVEHEIVMFRAAIAEEIALFLWAVQADAQQHVLVNDTMSGALTDIIADATARQLREIEENEE
jgi:hypothetical protein